MGRSIFYDDAISGSPQVRRWVFTLFNLDIDIEKAYNNNIDDINYIYTGMEECPTSKRLHWQGFIQFKRTVRRRKLQTIMEQKCWCNPMKGDYEDNLEYCGKQKLNNNWFEFGKFVSQGQRTDIDHCHDMLKNGCKMIDLMDEHFGDYIRYHRGFDKAKFLYDGKLRQKRREDLYVELICGETGMQKTTSILNKYGDENVFIYDFGKVEWWDGYEGEKIIILDDYDNQFPLTRLLRITDKIKVKLPTKGGFTYANFNKIYITTNCTLDEIHPNAKPKHRQALFESRIHNIINLYDTTTDEYDRRLKIKIKNKTKSVRPNGPKCRGNTEPDTDPFNLDISEKDLYNEYAPEGHNKDIDGIIIKI